MGQMGMQEHDGHWGCQNKSLAYPSFTEQSLHPCSGQGVMCCDTWWPTSIMLRMTAFFYAVVGMLTNHND